MSSSLYPMLESILQELGSFSTVTNFRLQWCNRKYIKSITIKSHRYNDQLFMVIDLIYWWQKHYVGHFFNVKDRSTISKTCHQHKLRHHRCSRIFKRETLTQYKHLVHSQFIFSIRFPLFILPMLLKKFIETIKFILSIFYSNTFKLTTD